MSDISLWCPSCVAKTGHTIISGRTCICSGCGDTHQAKSVKLAVANINKRKAESLISLARMNGLAATPEAPVEPVRVGKQGDIVMANKRLTAEEKADIVRRHEAGDSDTVLAADFGVCPGTITYTVKKAGKTKKVKKGKAGKKAAAAAAAAPAPSASTGNPLKDAIAAEVDGHLSGLDQRIEAKVREILAEMLK